MGHWAERLVDEFARQIGGNPDRQQLTDLATQAGRQLDMLSGRTFRPPRRTTSIIDPHGLPLVDVPDMQVGSLEGADGPWMVPDPVNPQMATALQVAPFAPPTSRSASIAEALWAAGQFVAQAARAGGLSKDYVLRWLGAVNREQRMDLMRRVMDPAFRCYVPILACSGNGWWIQISRRLIWMTNETEDEGRLFELLLDSGTTGDDPIPLVATEPILIVASMTQPADWAFTARVWADGVQRPIDHPWSKIAGAIQDHGLPTITLDPASTPEEVACQVILKGYWHGYIAGDEPALANAVAMAYPKQVESIRRGTDALNTISAAAILLENLVNPGFDPAQGAEMTRRYVRKKASIAVKNHKKKESPDRYPWTRIGISERRYYKLLPQFAHKINGRYDLDQEDIVKRMTDHVDKLERDRIIRSGALEFLEDRGFSREAARKWLQRHPLESIVNAYPRRPRIEDGS